MRYVEISRWLHGGSGPRAVGMRYRCGHEPADVRKLRIVERRRHAIFRFIEFFGLIEQQRWRGPPSVVDGSSSGGPAGSSSGANTSGAGSSGAVGGSPPGGGPSPSDQDAASAGSDQQRAGSGSSGSGSADAGLDESSSGAKSEDASTIVPPPVRDASVDTAGLPSVTLWVAGDSTASVYGAASAQQGWGEHLADYLISRSARSTIKRSRVPRS